MKEEPMGKWVRKTKEELAQAVQNDVIKKSFWDVILSVISPGSTGMNGTYRNQEIELSEADTYICLKCDAAYRGKRQNCDSCGGECECLLKLKYIQQLSELTQEERARLGMPE
jgi:hypothetical protein